MYIVPLSSSITPLNTMTQNVQETAPQTKSPSFTDVFSEVYNDMLDTQKIVNENSADIIMGGIDDLHTIYNNITKSQIALETFVAIRDAAMQSYKEIMQMSV